MSGTNEFLIQHGLPILFGIVLLEQIGIPIPAAPWFLAAGALAAAGHFNAVAGLLLATLACLIADTVWFYIGKFHGARVLSLLCKFSLEPDSCVRRTVNVFERYGWRGILIAKFIPGMSTITPPLAGMSGTNATRFLFFDALGALLYCGVYLSLGWLFSDQIAQFGAAFTHIGGNILRAGLIVIAIYIIWKYWQRQRLLRELRMVKIDVTELRKLIDGEPKPWILDLRSQTELEKDPVVILGAIHLAFDEVEKRCQEFPRDCEIITYCDCPNEITSAKTALHLRKRGFAHVRPLLGGFTAWRTANHPLSNWTKN
ncbi:MAG TPA: VTT domain-containing protein [Verrucomicrobiae bacterium]|jgi:membrane protein DedA with SNARE-associated domain/rhodanese-related sulfurtransferase